LFLSFIPLFPVFLHIIGHISHIPGVSPAKPVRIWDWFTREIHGALTQKLGSSTTPSGVHLHMWVNRVDKKHQVQVLATMWNTIYILYT
jgi:hypothetical protein